MESILDEVFAGFDSEAHHSYGREERENSRVQGEHSKCRRTGLAENPLGGNRGTHDTKAKAPGCADKFDVEVYCELFADAIIAHGYPLSIVLDEGTRELHIYLNPKVATISKRDLYEKVKCLVNARRKAVNGEIVQKGSVPEDDGETVDTDSDGEDGENVDFRC